MDVGMREAVQGMFEVCDMVENTGGIREKLNLDEELSLKSLLKMELFCYLSYLAAADGVISWKESRYLSELLDQNISPEKINDFIVEKNIYSVEFEEKVPMLLQIFVAFDNAIYNGGFSSHFDQELGNVLLQLYIILTKGLVEANGRTSEDMEENEERDAKIYIGMMQNYIETSTERHHTDIITGYSKNGKTSMESGVKAPAKNCRNSGSVKAPRKG